MNGYQETPLQSVILFILFIVGLSMADIGIVPTAQLIIDTASSILHEVFAP